MIRRIERAKGPRFEVYGQRAGKKHYVGVFDSQRAAEEAEQDAQVTQRKIARGELASDTDTKRTFASAVKIWLDKLEADGSRSWSEYTGRVDMHLIPAFGPMPLVDIRRRDVLAWREKTSRMVSANTTNTIVGTLSSAFSYFVEREWLGQNPCARVKVLAVETKIYPWLQSSEAITKLLSECTPNIRNLVAFLVGTGARLDEALHCCWNDIDLDHRLITIHRGRQGTTKSGKARRVPIFDSVLSVLREMKLSRGDNLMLWPGARPGRALSQPAVRNPFKKAAARAGLPKEFRVHDLRHSFASLFLVDGGDIFKLSRILGHSSVAITEKTYAHLKPDAFEADYGRVAFRMPSETAIAKLHAV